MPTATLENDVELSFDHVGDPDDELIVLVSGAGAPAAFWPVDFCERLARAGFFVVRYSHRDTGESTHFDAPYDIHALLTDLRLFLDRFAHRGAHLVGHSMGGYLAQLAICEFPERLWTATSIAAGSAVTPALHARLGTSVPDPSVWVRLTKNRPTGRFDHDLPGWLETWAFLNGDRPFDREKATDYTRSLYAGDPRNAQVATNHVHAMQTVPETLVDRLPGSRVPLLVLHGRRDPLVPIDNGEATARLAGAGAFRALDGAGHMFFDRDVWEEITSSLLMHFEKSRDC